MVHFQNMYQTIDYLQHTGNPMKASSYTSNRSQSIPHKTLHATRLQSMMTLSELAQQSRLSERQLRKYESGEEVPDICAMKVLERIFNRTIVS